MMAKLALITGSTRGIGLSVAKVPFRMLAGKGHDILLNGFGEPEEIGSVMDTCKQLGARRVEHHGADLCDLKQIESMFDFVTHKFGYTPDILVNNAGGQFVSPIEDFPVEMYNKIIALNLSAAFHTIRLSVKGMKRKGWGRIVNISSVHGLVASVNKSAYVASKHGIVGLSKEVALETAGTGVTCNAVCPGWVLTPLIVPQIEAIAEKEGVSFEEAKVILCGEKHPSKQFVMPEEVAALVCFLCSEDSKQLTGAAVPIDGAWTTV